MISAKEARARRNKISPSVVKALEELDLAVQLASPTKTRVDFHMRSLDEEQRSEMRNILISLGYEAFVAGEKLEVLW